MLGNFFTFLSYLATTRDSTVGCDTMVVEEDFDEKSAGVEDITRGHDKYMPVMIEYFSKWVELLALLDKVSKRKTYTFLDGVLSYLGAPLEVFSDQDNDFLGDFQLHFERAYIHHKIIFGDHPKADGLDERMV